MNKLRAQLAALQQEVEAPQVAVSTAPSKGGRGGYNNIGTLGTVTQTQVVPKDHTLGMVKVMDTMAVGLGDALQGVDELRGGMAEVHGRMAGFGEEMAIVRDGVAVFRGEMDAFRGDAAGLHTEFAELKARLTVVEASKPPSRPAFDHSKHLCDPRLCTLERLQKCPYNHEGSSEERLAEHKRMEEDAKAALKAAEEWKASLSRKEALAGIAAVRAANKLRHNPRK